MESPGTHTLRGAGRARDLRGGEGAGARHPARQYLGDAALLPGDRRRGRPLDPRLHQIYRRPCRSDARLGHRDRSLCATGSSRPAACSARRPGPTTPGWRCGACARSTCGSQRHQENGLKVARWLKEQPQVARVLHPALPDCPGHEHWRARLHRRDRPLLLRARTAATTAARTRLIDGLELFGIGYSWGGYREPRRARRSGADRDPRRLWKGRWSGSMSASRIRTI